MADQTPPLSEDKRRQLDGIVSQMETNQESPDNIQFVVDDFKKKYAGQAVETPPASPSMGSLAWTAAKTAASDLVSPFTSNAKNVYEREQAGNAAMGQGDYLGAAKSYAMENPIVNTMAGIVGAHVNEAGKAVENAQQGRYSEAIGHGVAAALPVVGPAAAAVGEDIGSGDPQRQAQAVGHVIAAVAGPKVVGKAIGAGTEVASRLGAVVQDTEAAAPTLLLKGIGPSNMQRGIPALIPKVMDDVGAVAEASGKPITNLQDFLDAIKTAKKANREQFSQLRDPQSQMGSQVDGAPIAKAIRDSISTRTKMMDPARARAVEAIAAKYDGPINVETADELLQGVNGELEGYYAKNPAGRGSSHVNPDTAGLVAEAGALRTQLYKTLDAPGGGAAARELQQRYGALSEVERTAQRQVIKQARQLPDNLTQTYGKMQMFGNLAKAGVKAVTGNITGAAADIAQGVAESKMADYIKAQQTTDALIQRAMAVWKRRPGAIEMPSPADIRGLLPPAVQRLGPRTVGGLDPSDVPGITQRGQYGQP